MVPYRTRSQDVTTVALENNPKSTLRAVFRSQNHVFAKKGALVIMGRRNCPIDSFTQLPKGGRNELSVIPSAP